MGVNTNNRVKPNQVKVIYLSIYLLSILCKAIIQIKYCWTDYTVLHHTLQVYCYLDLVFNKVVLFEVTEKHQSRQIENISESLGFCGETL